MKKILVLLLAMVAAFMFSLTAFAGEECTHANKQLEEAVQPTCCMAGYEECYYCPDCYSYVDMNGDVVEFWDLEIPALNDKLVKVDAVAATCCATGILEHYECTECGSLYWSEEGANGGFFNVAFGPSVIEPATKIEYVEAVEASAHKNGTQAYFYCPDCDVVYDEDMRLTNRMNLVIPAEHNLQYEEAVEPTCCMQGVAECLYCEECYEYFDLNGDPVEYWDLMIPALNDKLVKVEAVAATCCATGILEHYECTECGSLYWSEEGANGGFFNMAFGPSVIEPATDLEYVEAVEVTNHKNGSHAYFYCPKCDVVYDEDMRLTNRLNLVIPSEHTLEHVEAKKACHANGYAEYWFCAECDAVFTDAEGKYLTNRLNLVIPAVSELVYVPAADACHVPGTQEYWYCPDCEAVYADEAGTQLTNRMNLKIAPDCELVHMEAVDACHNNGTAEYWFCPDCEAVYADEAGTQLTNRMNLTIAGDMDALKHFDAVAATADKEGMLEHWYCEGCDCYFTDAEGKYNVARLSLIIPVLEVVDTGDSVSIVPVVAMAAAVAAFAVAFDKKRKMA